MHIPAILQGQAADTLYSAATDEATNEDIDGAPISEAISCRRRAGHNSKLESSCVAIRYKNLLRPLRS
jgi:hypothetical protein